VKSVDEEIAFATIEELNALLISREISSVELTRSALQRLESLGPRFNALASLMPERALREAVRADRALARRGRAIARSRSNGALLGIPYGAKDLLAARGAPTSYGSAIYRDQILDSDAAPIARLHGAGAVLAAKLALMELAGFEGTGPSASVHGPGINPWNPDYWAGGSSNGSAVAVATGLVPFALASETGGSIGTPASLCGVTAIRPTYGLVSRHGSMALSWTLDKIGVMARSAWDCALVLEAIAGSDLRDPASAGRRFRADGVGLTDRPFHRRLLVGFAREDFEHFAEEPIRPALADALGALADLGIDLVETTIPADVPYWESIVTIIGAEGGTVFADIIEGKDLESITDVRSRAALTATLDIRARDYLNAMRVRRRIQRSFTDLFRTVDALVTFSLATNAIRIDQPFAQSRLVGGNTAMVAASNLAGLPALFLPCGPGTNGLPVGIQLVGSPFSEALLLTIGRALQSRTSWHTAHPSVEEAGAEARR